MASKQSDLPWSPSSLLPFNSSSRRNSVASLSSRAGLDKQTISQALDDIHATASRSSGLTAFNDFAPPPAPAGDDKSKAGTLGNLYSRFKSSVGTPSKDRPSSRASSQGPVLGPPSVDHSDTFISRPSSRRSELPVSVDDSRSLLSNRAGVEHRQSQDRSAQPSVESRHVPAADHGRSDSKSKGRISNASKDQPASARRDESAHLERDRDINSPAKALSQHRSELSMSLTQLNARSERNSVSSELASGVNSPLTGFPRPAYSLAASDSSRTKSLPFAGVTNISVPASSVYDLNDVHRDSGPSSFTSFPESPALKRPSSNAPPLPLTNDVMHEMKRKVLSRDFWMKDENAKVCFSCGDSFTTFRRKHHCRTCGQIYDAKCTVLIPGNLFDQPGRLRICRTCENIIMGDESSDLSETEDQLSALQPKSIRFSNLPWDGDDDHHQNGFESAANAAAARNPHDARRKATGATAQDAPAPVLTRPSSSRSLRSMAGRPRSSSHRLRRPRHQHIRSLGTATDGAIPFQKLTATSSGRDPWLPAFHTDAIVDPDIAPYLSDEASSDGDMQSIASTLHGDSEQMHNLQAPFRKPRPRPISSRSVLDVGIQDHDDRHGPRRKRIGRTQSTSSLVPRLGTSQRLIRSDNLFAEAPPTNQYAIEWTDPTTPIEAGQRPFELDRLETPEQLKPRAAVAELDNASLRHVKRLLRQLLDDRKISSAKQWRKLLLSLLLRCAEEIDPNIQRGDDIDIRHYVKLKKAPGRKPADSLYVSGVVFSQNIALKGMPRSVSNARILILSFPIVYARHRNHFMSLGPVIAQESEYLRNIVRRITALNPSVVLVQRQIAGMALDLLKDAGLTVVCNMKESVLQAISRCTQTRIITSVDKLTMDPDELGYCEKFEFKTFVFDGMRKTFAYVSGCAKDLGCTIVLRGAPLEELRKIKRVTEFMCYVVYNLKLETSLIRDQFMTLSSESEDVSTSSTMGQLQLHLSQKRNEPQRLGANAKPDNKDGEPLEYDQLVDDLRKRVLSISPGVRLPPPYLLLKAQEQEWEMRTFRDNLEKAKALEIENSDSAPKTFELLQPEMIFQDKSTPTRALREALEGIRRAECEKAEAHFAALKRRWEAYVAGALDPFSPLSHQQIVVLYSIVSTPSSNACEGPDLIGINFYQERGMDGDLEPDVPLGEYIERLCDQAKSPCTASNCEQLMIDHHRQYVHGEGQVSVHTKRHAPKLRGLENTILMWSVCRECSQETPVVPMSRNSWKFSFAKYMELTFWSRTLKPRAGFCPHDVQRNHIRYFGFNSLAVSIQYDPIQIMEVIVPRNSISWKVEKDVSLKNLVYTRMERRMKDFLASVSERINGINLKNVEPENLKDCKKELESFRQRVVDDEAFVIRKLQEKYSGSKYYEVIPLNRAMRAMQERVSVWTSLFADFERKYLPSERDIRRLAAQRLKDVYLDREKIGEDEHIPLDDEKQVASVDFARISDPEIHDQVSVDAPALKDTDVSPERHGPAAEVVDTLDLAVDNLPSSQSPLLSSRVSALSPERRAVDSPKHTSPPVSQHGRDSSLDNISSPVGSNVLRSAEEQGGRRTGDAQRLQPSSPPLLRSNTQPPIAQQSLRSSEGDLGGVTRSASTKTTAQSLIPVPAKAATSTGPEKFDIKQLGKTGNASTATKAGKAAMQSLIPRSIVSKKMSSRVSALARQFEQMSREFEREKLRERRQRLARVRQTQVYSIGSYQPVMEVYRDAHKAVQEQEPTLTPSRETSNDQDGVAEETFPEDTTDLAHTASNVSPSGTTQALETLSENLKSEESTLLASYPPSDTENAASDTERTVHEGYMDSLSSEPAAPMSPEKQLDLLDIPKHDKTSIMKMLTSFWSERSASGWTDLRYPLSAAEHIFSDSDVIPREDEPSSVIAFALASEYYRSQLQSFRDRVKADPTVLVNPPLGETDIEQTLLGRTATHISYTFPAGSARMRCKVFFAESFDAIQQKCGVADRFVESLSRCFKFDSKGGKTKSIFLKTLDDRFVLKSLSQVETDAFLRFAPDYFDYMSKCLFHNLPSALAKMLGFYEVTIKNPETGVDFSWFLQVMENVFYEGPSNQTFDLKGSMRNRRVKSTGEKNEVLLDENLLDYISSTPIYVRNHSNSQLASSISNDTLFCSKQNVMDYSLVVGLYDDRQELMVGIIDYIRTYTWDKKLESWIKDRGKNKPTVRSPKEYRNRFRASISRYFPLAPSCWQIFGVQRTEQPPLAWWESLGHRNEVDEDDDGAAEADGDDNDAV